MGRHSRSLYFVMLILLLDKALRPMTGSWQLHLKRLWIRVGPGTFGERHVVNGEFRLIGGIWIFSWSGCYISRGFSLMFGVVSLKSPVPDLLQVKFILSSFRLLNMQWFVRKTLYI